MPYQPSLKDYQEDLLALLDRRASIERGLDYARSFAPSDMKGALLRDFNREKVRVEVAIELLTTRMVMRAC